MAMQQEAQFGTRMEGLAASRAATQAVSRPPGPQGQQDPYRTEGFRLCQAAGTHANSSSSDPE